jgi:hypothetical protein
MDQVTVLLLKGTDTLVIKKNQESALFIATPDSIIISRESLILILNYLMKHDLLDVRIIQGILEEAHTG